MACRSRTLLHFLEREVCRQHPEGSSLQAALPSARDASKLNMAQLQGELLEMTAGLQQVGSLEAWVLWGHPRSNPLGYLALCLEPKLGPLKKREEERAVLLPDCGCRASTPPLTAAASNLPSPHTAFLAPCPVGTQVQAAVEAEGCSVAYVERMADVYNRAAEELEALAENLAEAEAAFRWVTWPHGLC